MVIIMINKRLRAVSCFLCALLAAASFSGCTKQGNQGNADGTGTDKVINDGKPVTIIVSLGEYEPTDNEVPTQDAPTVFNSTRELIKKFEKMYPNVTVEVDKSHPTTGGDYVAGINQWMLPRLAAGTQMDVATNLGGAGTFGDSDWFIDLTDILQTPNEYVSDGEKGSEKWIDQYPSYLFSSNSIVNTKGQIVAIPYMLDCGSPTAYYYNKKIFNELNITPPKTWEQMFTACEKIKKAGYIPFAPNAVNTNIDLQNWDTQFSLGPIFAMLQMDVLDYNKDGMQDSVERVRAVKEGIYNPLKNTYAMDIWKQVKRKYDTKNSPILQEGYETTDYEPLWQEGKVAIWEDGMWKLPYMISDTSLDFEFGMFPPPVISKDTLSYLPEVEFTEKGPNKPGVQASFTFLKKSMEGKSAAVKEACVEFVKYMTTSTNMSAVVLEKRGAVLGSTVNCVVPPELEDWMSQQFPKYPSTTGWLTANGADYRQQGNKLFEQWLLNKIDDKQFATQLNDLSQKDADAIIKSSELDTSGWTIKE